MSRTSSALSLWIALLVIVFLTYWLVGAESQLGLTNYWTGLWAGPPGESSAGWIMWQIRLPRALAALMTGALLGWVGATYQAAFRNALAEPFLLGSSSGAALVGSLAMSLAVGALGWKLALVAVMGAVGACLSLALVWFLARRAPGSLSQNLVISGVVVGSLLSSLVTLVVIVSGNDANQVLRWLLGSFTPMPWSQLLWLIGAAVLSLVCLKPLLRELHILSTGEATAKTLGVSSERVIARVAWVGSATTGLAVGVVGIVGFVGLLAPHVARTMFGQDIRRHFVAAGLAGATMTLVADLVSQRLVRSIEVPVGAVTAVLGALALGILLQRRQAAR